MNFTVLKAEVKCFHGPVRICCFLHLYILLYFRMKFVEEVKTFFFPSQSFHTCSPSRVKNRPLHEMWHHCRFFSILCSSIFTVEWVGRVRDLLMNTEAYFGEVLVFRRQAFCTAQSGQNTRLQFPSPSWKQNWCFLSLQQRESVGHSHVRSAIKAKAVSVPNLHWVARCRGC